MAFIAECCYAEVLKQTHFAECRVEKYDIPFWNAYPLTKVSLKKTILNKCVFLLKLDSQFSLKKNSWSGIYALNSYLLSKSDLYISC